MNMEVVHLSLAFAQVWIATDNAESVDYSYGGTRLVSPQIEDCEVHMLLRRLMVYESALKNRLINRAIRRNVYALYKEQVPAGFVESTVGGARCLIRPNNEEVAAILGDPRHPQFRERSYSGDDHWARIRKLTRGMYTRRHSVIPCT